MPKNHKTAVLTSIAIQKQPTNLSQNSLVGWRSKLIHSTAVKVAGKGSYGQLCVLGVKLCPKNTKRAFWPPSPSKNIRQTWPKTHSWDEDQNWSIPRLLKLPGREVTANYVFLKEQTSERHACHASPSVPQNFMQAPWKKPFSTPMWPKWHPMHPFEHSQHPPTTGFAGCVWVSSVVPASDVTQKSMKRPFWPPSPSKNSRQTWPKTHLWESLDKWHHLCYERV